MATLRVLGLVADWVEEQKNEKNVKAFDPGVELYIKDTMSKDLRKDVDELVGSNVYTF